jgi:hypothetical protein
VVSLREVFSMALGWALLEKQMKGGEPQLEPWVAADVVLAALGDLGGRDLEAVGRQLNPKLWTDDYWTASRFVFQTHAESWENALGRARRNQLEDIRRVLAALVGGEEA